MTAKNLMAAASLSLAVLSGCAHSKAAESGDPPLTDPMSDGANNELHNDGDSEIDADQMNREGNSAMMEEYKEEMAPPE